MQIAWGELLFSKTYNGQPNKPFVTFLKENTRVATLGHSEASLVAHNNAIKGLEHNNWAACKGFSEDVRLTNEIVTKKLSQLPNADDSIRGQISEQTRDFALRCQIKRFIKDCYIQLIIFHYQEISNNTQTVDWQWLLYKPSNYGSKKTLFEACDAIAHRIFWNEEIARQVSDNIMKKLKENNWSKLSGFQGVGSPEGYFKKVFHTQAQDFFKAMYGSCQPKTWMRNAGVMMVALFRKLCCEKISPTYLREHSESLQNELLGLAEDEASGYLMSIKEIDSCIRLILEKEVNCQAQKFIELNETSIKTEDHETSYLDNQGGQKFEDKADMSSWMGTLVALQILIGQLTLEEAIDSLKIKSEDPSNPNYEMIKSLLNVLAQLDNHKLAKLQLSPDEKLVIQYRFIHQLSRKEVASHLSLQLNKKVESHQIRYDEKKALSKLSKMLMVNK